MLSLQTILLLLPAALLPLATAAQTDASPSRVVISVTTQCWETYIPPKAHFTGPLDRPKPVDTVAPCLTQTYWSTITPSAAAASSAPSTIAAIRSSSVDSSVPARPTIAKPSSSRAGSLSTSPIATTPTLSATPATSASAAETLSSRDPEYIAFAASRASASRASLSASLATAAKSSSSAAAPSPAPSSASPSPSSSSASKTGPVEFHRPSNGAAPANKKPQHKRDGDGGYSVDLVDTSSWTTITRGSTPTEKQLVVPTPEITVSIITPEEEEEEEHVEGREYTMPGPVIPANVESWRWKVWSTRTAEKTAVTYWPPRPTPTPVTVTTTEAGATVTVTAAAVSA